MIQERDQWTLCRLTQIAHRFFINPIITDDIFVPDKHHYLSQSPSINPRTLVIMRPITVHSSLYQSRSFHIKRSELATHPAASCTAGE